MLNWRTILGLILILLGVRGLYIVVYLKEHLSATLSPTAVGAACAIWTLVGMFLLVQGTRKKPEL